MNIAEEQSTSENQNFAAKPTLPKTDEREETLRRLHPSIDLGGFVPTADIRPVVQPVSRQSRLPHLAIDIPYEPLEDEVWIDIPLQ